MLHSGRPGLKDQAGPPRDGGERRPGAQGGEGGGEGGGAGGAQGKRGHTCRVPLMMQKAVARRHTASGVGRPPLMRSGYTSVLPSPVSVVAKVEVMMLTCAQEMNLKFRPNFCRTVRML